MFALVIIGIFILIIGLIIFIEYKNEKKYQEERRKRSKERRKTRAPYDPKAKVQKPLQKQKEQKAKKNAAVPGAKERVDSQRKKKKSQTSTESYRLKTDEQGPSEVIEEIQKEAQEKKKIYDLPKCKYPKFNHSRLLDMGLSEKEVKEFVQELIPQINNQIPLIKEAMEISDFHNMERLTHSIKGSSTTVGTGGISDLLVEYNTYLKKGKELPIAEAYFTHLVRYAKELEEQYA